MPSQHHLSSNYSHDRISTFRVIRSFPSYIPQRRRAIIIPTSRLKSTARPPARRAIQMKDSPRPPAAGRTRPSNPESGHAAHPIPARQQTDGKHLLHRFSKSRTRMKYKNNMGMATMNIVTPVPSGVMTAANIIDMMTAHRQCSFQKSGDTMPSDERPTIITGSSKTTPNARRTLERIKNSSTLKSALCPSQRKVIQESMEKGMMR